MLQTAALPLLLVFLGGWGVWAILVDQQPEFADALVHDSVRLYHSLTAGSPPLAEAFKTGYRPFLCYLPATLLFLLTGPSLVVLRLTFLAQYLGVVYLGYSIGRQLAGRQAGLLAAVVVGTFPSVFGWGRMPYMDFGMGLLLLVGLRVLLTCDLASRSCGARLGLAVGLGLLTKIAYPVFALGPLIWAAIYRVRRLRHLVGLGVAAAVALAVAGWWYAINWRMVTVNIGMSSGSQRFAAEDVSLGRRVALALPEIGDKLLSYTAEVDGAVWLLGLALVGGLAAWRLRTLAGPSLALLSLGLWLPLALTLLFHQSRRYVLPVYMVAGVLAGTSLQTVLVWLGGRRLATAAVGLLSLFLLGDFVALNLGLPVKVRPRSAFLVAGPRVDGLGLLAPDRRPLDTFPAVLEAVDKRYDSCLLVFAAAELHERQFFREQLLQLGGGRPLPICHRLDDYRARRPRRPCVVLVSGAAELYSWAHQPQSERGIYERCLSYAWLRQARPRRQVGRWGPSPVGLVYTLYELDPAALGREVTPPAYCRLRQVPWDDVVHRGPPR